MKRYSVAKTFSGKTCGIWQFIERDDGEWVKYDEAEKIRNDLGVRILKLRGALSQALDFIESKGGADQKKVTEWDTVLENN